MYRTLFVISEMKKYSFNSVDRGNTMYLDKVHT